MATETLRLRPAETAAHLRATLKQAFPGVRFSVRTRTYAGGSSIDVSYLRGPAHDRVARIADRFNGRDFDGMTDSSTYRPPVLLCDETGNTREVDYGGSFVFVRREYDADRESRIAGAATEAATRAIESRYADGHAPNRYSMRVHAVMDRLDWPEGQSVAEFAARCAEAYFS